MLYKDIMEISDAVADWFYQSELLEEGDKIGDKAYDKLEKLSDWCTDKPDDIFYKMSQTSHPDDSIKKAEALKEKFKEKNWEYINSLGMYGINPQDVLTFFYGIIDNEIKDYIENDYAEDLEAYNEYIAEKQAIKDMQKQIKAEFKKNPKLTQAKVAELFPDYKTDAKKFLKSLKDKPEQS